MPSTCPASLAPAPPPPSAAGTVSANRPASDNPLKFPNGKLASRSCAAARSAKPTASSRAQSRRSGRRGSARSLAAPYQAPSPCRVQSEQVKDLLAQIRKVGIATMARMGPLHLDIGLDACGPLGENDDAVGEHQRFLRIMGDQERGKALALP